MVIYGNICMMVYYDMGAGDIVNYFLSRKSIAEMRICSCSDNF